jgi:hypothetical protein
MSKRLDSATFARWIARTSSSNISTPTGTRAGGTSACFGYTSLSTSPVRFSCTGYVAFRGQRRVRRPKRCNIPFRCLRRVDVAIYIVSSYVESIKSISATYEFFVHNSATLARFYGSPGPCDVTVLLTSRNHSLFSRSVVYIVIVNGWGSLSRWSRKALLFAIRGNAPLELPYVMSTNGRSSTTQQERDGVVPQREPGWSIAIKNFSPQW